MKTFLISILVLLAFTSNGHYTNIKKIQHYLYTSSDDLNQIQSLITRKDIAGVQIVYNWKDLEIAQGKYDFSRIERDLNYLDKRNKKLFIQIQDRFFEPRAKNIPAYLLKEVIYGGGIVRQADNPEVNKTANYGWVAQQWNPYLRKRFQGLIVALATRFDGHIFGINLPETAIDVDKEHDTTGFSCDKYFEAEIENIKFTRKVFKKSFVIQYVNFFPCEWNNSHKYMSRLFSMARGNNIGLGGPDIVPNKKGQMMNSYPFFNKYKGELSIVAMAVQEPTLTYTTPVTLKPFTKDEFVEYAENYLGADIIFWSTSTPWLQQ